jgi:hypothetical protein
VSTQTLIQLKYSSANSAPITLDIAEPAYSFVSNKLFVGDLANNPIAIGGKYYTDLIDANTAYATPGTIVVRDESGGALFDDLRSNTLVANSTVYAGFLSAAPLPGATNPIIGASGNANNYVQSYIRNINSGTESSADFVAYSDIGSDVSGWIDMGITSSTFNHDSFGATGAEEGYIFMSATSGSSTSGNLVIATDSTGVYNDIVFQTGGFTGAPRPIAFFRNNQGLIIKADSEASSNSTGSLVSSGGAGFQGNVYADALYDFGSRVLSTVNVNSGGGISVSSSKSGNTQNITVTNNGVVTLTANSGEVTTSSSTGNITFGLADTTVTSGVYGGSTQVPTFTVDAKGRLTQAGNVAISTSFTLAGNTGTDTLNTGDTLTIIGNGSGIVSTVTDNTITIATDTTVLRSNTSGIGPQFITTDLEITGNLVVIGSQTISNTTIAVTDDSLLQLANNNTTDVLDIGFFGQYGATGIKYAGLFRKAADNFYLFKDVTDNPTANVINFTAANRATLDANITGGIVSGLAAAIDIADGGTNNTTFNTGEIIHYDGSKLVSLANTGTAGTYANASHVAVITTDSLGRVSSVTNTKIAIAADQITSGLIAVNRGGTNNDTYTTGALLQYDGSKFISTANTGTAGTYGNTTHIPVITTDDYGRVTNVANTALQVDLSSSITGTLGVLNGGTGSSSFTTKGVIVSDNSSSTGALTPLTGSAYQVLQLNSAGIPTFAGLSGGTF